MQLKSRKQTSTNNPTRNPFKRTWKGLTDWEKSPVFNKIEEASERGITQLVKCLKHDDMYVLWATLWALEKIGKPAVPDLIDALKDWEVGNRAAWMLVRIRDTSAVPDLIDLVEDENENVRKYAAQILGAIGDTSTVDALVNALDDKEKGVRGMAAQALGEIAKDNPEAVVQEIIDTINGKIGEELLLTTERNSELFNRLHQLMLQCGKVMEDAA